MYLPEETTEYTSCVVGLLLVGVIPVDGPNLICLCIVDSDRVLGFVVAQQDLVIFEVYGLASHVVPEQFFYGCLDADVPEVDCPVPTPT